LSHFSAIRLGTALPAARTKGDDIRARIEANRRKRLAIAEAMKREAGVTGHEINRHDLGGLAFIGTGRIKSPEGRNLRQLYIVAHECGHIFLQNEGEGYWLAPHVKELEAESYAHQAFREHGMNLPRELSDWGRIYVGSWIEKDRAAGFAIDPRAEAYANGTRSPYEPLRMVPRTWRLHRGHTRAPFKVSETKAAHSLSSRLDRIGLREEITVIARLVGNGLFLGWSLTYIALKFAHGYAPMPSLFEGPMAHPTWLGLQYTIVGAVVGACLFVLLRTATRMPRPRLAPPTLDELLGLH